MNIDVSIDRPSMKRYLRYISATPKQVDKAAYTSIKRSMRWGFTQLVRGLSEHHDIPRKVILGKSSSGNEGKGNASRVREKQGYGKSKGYLWVGSNPVKAAYVGALRQQRAGAKAGRHAYSGAFVATMSSGHRGIYKRQGRKRLGIDEQVVKLHTASQVVAYVRRKLPLKLRAQMDQQMNYQLNVKGRR